MESYQSLRVVVKVLEMEQSGGGRHIQNTDRANEESKAFVKCRDM